MRVLFIEKRIDYEPQGIMSMSGVLKEAGHEVALSIAAQEDPLTVAREFRPGIIGYSVMTGSQHYYLDLNQRLKEELDFFAVFGGPHPTFFPEMIHERGIDGLCIGEGEGPIVDLADALDNGGVVDHRGLAFPHIPNWWFKVDGQVVRNQVRPLLRALSELPMPDRALIYNKHEYTRNSPIKHFMGSRGCPYNCTYCFNHAWYQIYKGEKRGYQREVDHLLDEVEWVQERYPLEHVAFLDDLFIIFVDWLEEFAEKYPKRIGLPFFCNVRANLVNEERVALLKKAGCATVSMGIETANDRIRNQLLQRKMTREMMIEAGQLLKEAGIHLTATSMLGLPTGTLEDDLATMKLNSDCQVSYAHAFLFQPYPGTELGEFTFENNLMEGSFDDISPVAWDRSIIIFASEMEKRQVEHLQRLFAIGVEWPFLTPLIRWLIKLPHNRVVDTLFWWVHKLWKGYAIKTRVHPHRVSLKNLRHTVKHFLSMDA